MPPQQRRRRSSQQQPTRSQQRTSSQPRTSQRRSERRAAAEVVDYSRDYAFVRRDLKRIAFWSILLLVGMIVVSFVI